MAKRSIAKKASPLASKLYLSKANKFLEGALSLMEQGNWESAAVLAVHSVISSCDALTVNFLSKRHSGVNHQGVIDLLGELPLNNAEIKNKKAQIRQVITKKTNVEYDEKPVRQLTARKLVVEAERINKWANSHL